MSEQEQPNGKVVSLKSGEEIPTGLQVNEQLVMMLEHLLVDAKAGRLVDGAFVGVNHVGNTLTQWSFQKNLIIAVGLAELLKFNIFAGLTRTPG